MTTLEQLQQSLAMVTRQVNYNVDAIAHKADESQFADLSDQVDAGFEGVVGYLQRHDERLERIEIRITALESRIDRLETRMTNLETTVVRGFDEIKQLLRQQS